MSSEQDNGEEQPPKRGQVVHHDGKSFRLGTGTANYNIPPPIPPRIRSISDEITDPYGVPVVDDEDQYPTEFLFPKEQQMNNNGENGEEENFLTYKKWGAVFALLLLGVGGRVRDLLLHGHEPNGHAACREWGAGDAQHHKRPAQHHCAASSPGCYSHHGGDT